MDSQFRLKNDSLFVLAEAPGGVYNAEQLRVVCDIVKSSSSFMKLTSEQSLGLMVEPEGIPALQMQLAKVGLLLKPYRLAQIPAAKSCLGSLCPDALQDALGDAINLTEMLATHPSASHSILGMTLNGCSRSCVAGATDDIHLIAEDTGYKISIGGRNAELAQLGQLVAENVMPNALPDVISRILSLYSKERQGDEQLFDTIERTGIGMFVAAAAGEELLPEIGAEEIGTEALGTEQLGTEEIGTEELGTEELEAESVDLEPQSVETPAPEGNSFDVETLPQPIVHSADELETTGLEPEVHFDAAHDTGAEPAFEFDLPDENESSEATSATLFAGLPKPGQYDENGRELNLPEAPLTSDGVDALAKNLLSEPMEHLALESFENEPVATPTDDSSDSLTSLQADSLLADEGEMELTDATEEDLNRVTQSIRSEAGFDGDFERSSPLPAALPQAFNTLAAVPATPPPAAVQPLPAKKGRFRVRTVEGQLELNLPSGYDMQIPLDVFLEGEPFEMDTEDGVVSVERNGQALKVRFNGMSMGIPLKQAA